MAKSPKKTPKLREDASTMAYRIMLEATGQAPKTPDPDAGKDAAAVKRGRAGGTKGGIVRAAKLPPDVRKAIAEKAAAARWGKKKPSPA